MKLRHPFLLAAMAMLFLATSFPAFFGIFSYAQTLICLMASMGLGAMTRVYSQNPARKPLFWIIGLTAVIIFYNPLISPASEYWSLWPLVHLFSSAFMATAAFLSTEIIAIDKKPSKFRKQVKQKAQPNESRFLLIEESSVQEL